MSVTGAIINTDGNTSQFTSEHDSPTLKELQRIVGGYIEFIFLSKNQVLVINEDSKNKNLSINKTATEMLRMEGREDTILGQVLLINSDAIR